MSELISIHEAASRGIERLRQPQWANPLDHLKIDIVKGRAGPWVHLWAPFNKECNGRDPFDMLAVQIDYNSAEWLEYTGPIETSDEYKAGCAVYDGCLADERSPLRIGAEP